MQRRRLLELAPSAETNSSIDTKPASALAYHQVATEYLTNHAPQAAEYLSYLHESDLNHEIILKQQPDYAVLIPIAANETEENIRGALDALLRQPFQKPEVFLYGNYTKDTPAHEITALNSRLDNILRDYRDAPQFSALRAVVVPTRYYHDFSMVQLRKEATDMIAADALERGLPFNYPVVSLDADAFRLSRTTLESLISPIKEEGVILTYGDSNVGYNNIPDNASTRLAVTAEIIRRMEVRCSTDKESYPEESCTAFSLGAYCMADGYPPLIQNDYDKSNLIGETPILIRQMSKLFELNAYKSIVEQIIDGVASDIAPRHVDNALVTRNGRRNLEYFATQLANATAQPEKFADTTRLLQKVMRARPTLDCHIATGGSYSGNFGSQEKMRETNGIPATQIALSRHALDLVLNDYFGPDRTALIKDDQSREMSADSKLRIQQLLLHRYFDKHSVK
jgi:hypothetical protein